MSILEQEIERIKNDSAKRTEKMKQEAHEVHNKQMELLKAGKIEELKAYCASLKSNK